MSGIIGIISPGPTPSGGGGSTPTNPEPTPAETGSTDETGPAGGTGETGSTGDTSTGGNTSSSGGDTGTGAGTAATSGSRSATNSSAPTVSASDPSFADFTLEGVISESQRLDLAFARNLDSALARSYAEAARLELISDQMLETMRGGTEASDAFARDLDSVRASETTSEQRSFDRAA